MLRKRTSIFLVKYFVYRFKQNTNRIRELIKHGKTINREKFINKLFGVDTYIDIELKENQYTYEQLKNEINFQTNDKRKTMIYYGEKYLKKTYNNVNLSYFFYCKNKILDINRMEIIQIIH